MRIPPILYAVAAFASTWWLTALGWPGWLAAVVVVLAVWLLVELGPTATSVVRCAGRGRRGRRGSRVDELDRPERAV